MVNKTPPKTKHQVRAFIRLVNYYGDMWSRRYHILQTLIAIISDMVMFRCKNSEQKSFDDIKRIVVHNTFLAYMYFNKRIFIHNDSSI